MKLKTDLYTKIVLTAIALFLGVIVCKDINFVSKATANELDLSDAKIENANDAEGTTFFIYENAKINQPIGKYSSYSGRIGDDDIPQYIVTSKQGYIRTR